MSGSVRRLRFTADDFGMSESVNEAVERAHREGVLTDASLMVGGFAAADAIRRAKRLPDLRVGLHLTLVQGPPMLPRPEVPDLINARGWFPSGQVEIALDYVTSRRVRRQLAAEIRAQFTAFAATGLTLSHADAHKHMHLHPTVGRMMLQIGPEFGLRHIRVPAEPLRVLRRCGQRIGLGGRLLHAWCRVLRAQAHAAGVTTDDAVFGLAWTGHMTEDRVLRLLSNLPPRGTMEFYFHPATRRDAPLDALMPTYEHQAELATLLSPRVRAALA